jgi:hypothetical protein
VHCKQEGIARSQHAFFPEKSHSKWKNIKALGKLRARVIPIAVEFSAPKRMTSSYEPISGFSVLEIFQPAPKAIEAPIRIAS